jgi:hypothetical protein
MADEFASTTNPASTGLLKNYYPEGKTSGRLSKALEKKRKKLQEEQDQNLKPRTKGN